MEATSKIFLIARDNSGPEFWSDWYPNNWVRNPSLALFHNSRESAQWQLDTEVSLKYPSAFIQPMEVTYKMIVEEEN